MTKKKDTPAILDTTSGQVLTLEALKGVGAVPGTLPPVKRQVKWTNPDTETEHSFDVYVRRQAYKDVADVLEGRTEFSTPTYVSQMICSPDGKQVFTREQAEELEQTLLQTLAQTVIEVNTKKKQPLGKKSS